MSELLQAAKAVIEEWRKCESITPVSGPALLRAVERAEKQEAVGFDEWFEPNYKMLAELWTGECAQVAWIAAQQAERERIRARAKLAAERTWRAGDWYVGPQHNNIEAFVEELLRDDDAQP